MSKLIGTGCDNMTLGTMDVSSPFYIEPLKKRFGSYDNDDVVAVQVSDAAFAKVGLYAIIAVVVSIGAILFAHYLL